MINFKQIQLAGFKSFADKTTITLGDGVTCIVGPNGCGKSNVADSIRWVLGEQSAKMMRGSQMMDVIFSGTESRRQMSYCEVTLTFDNTNRIFDIDEDEVEMTRRLYRNGDSEYLLNQKTTRMKVLTGLLHGAGAAKEGYSIIGQGRIEQIMNAKPEDRRSIFEEATGIVVFKDRKAEAERKLKASKDNLFVFVQRMQEVERQLNPLKKAAENALKHREVYEELRKDETNLYIIRHDGAEGEKSVVLKKKEKCENNAGELAARMDALAAEYRECKDYITDVDAELADLYERIRRYDVSIANKSGDSRVFTERAKAVKEKLVAARDEITFSLKRIEDIEREIRRSEALSGKNQDRIIKMRAESDMLNQKIETFTAKISEYDYMSGEQRKKVMDTFKELSEIRQNIGSLAAQKDFLKERIAEIEKDMEKVRESRNQSRKLYNESVEKSNALSDFLGSEVRLLSEAEESVREADGKVQQLVRQVYDTKAMIESINRSLTTQIGLRERFNGYTENVKTLMNHARNNSELQMRIKGLIADVVSCDKRYEVAIETAFGGAMQNVITKSREDAKQLISYLKRSGIGRITFLPIEAYRPQFEGPMIKAALKDKGAIDYAINLVKYDKQYENVIHNLLGNTLIVDDIDNAKSIAERYPGAFKIVTLEGDLFARAGSMTGGTARAAGNLLANERIIKELEESLEAKKSFLARSDSKRGELEANKTQAENQLKSLREKLQNARLELATLTEKQSALMQAVTSAEGEYSAYSQSLSEIYGRLSGLDDEYSGVSQGASELTEQSDKASSEMDDMSAQYDKLVKDRDEAAERVHSLRVEVAALESSVKASAENVARLNKEKADLQAKIELSNRNIPEIVSQMEELNAQAEKTALTEEEQAVVADLRRQVEEARAKKEKTNVRITEIDAERLKCYSDREEALNKAHEHEMAIAKIDSDLENLRQRIEEAYGETYEGCLKYKVDDFDITGVNARIANLKRQITLIGPVNPHAIDEYEEVNTRYEGMLVEQQDLEKGISDLTTALEEIRSEMQKIFDEGFNIINENFKRTFKELFGGGRAELQLDYSECEDPLDAGVEIIASPPGKKLSKISLLSGGERALTAIAILFAIIGMRPMPFCVLDEIEAALDEANVARYAKYLKKFSEHTQFIVITHRKPTMENADILFGVTMEEKGVSKVVSVKLSEVEAKLGGDTIS